MMAFLSGTPFTLIFANVLHSMIALAWIAGLRGLAGPLSAAAEARLLGTAVTLPALILVAKALGAPSFPEAWQLLRAGRWAAALAGSTVTAWFVGLLLGGTVLLFITQEVLPLLMIDRRRFDHPAVADERLQRALARVQSQFAYAGVWRWSMRKIRAFRLETPLRIAAIHGFTDPRLLVSTRVLAELDDEELDGLIAHEFAHTVYYGNSAMLVAWALRALQAWNPGALVAFRILTEKREEVCDSLAAFALRKPAALASALLKLYVGAPLSEGERADWATRARSELAHRAETEVTRMRVRALLDTEPVAAIPAWLSILIVLAMGAMMWAIG